MCGVKKPLVTVKTEGIQDFSWSLYRSNLITTFYQSKNDNSNQIDFWDVTTEEEIKKENKFINETVLLTKPNKTI